MTSSNVGVVVPAPGKAVDRPQRLVRRLQALSEAALRAQEALSPDDVLEAVGTQLKSLALDCHFTLLDEARDELVIQYVTIAPAVLRTVERLLGIRAVGFREPVARVGILREAVRARRAAFAPAAEPLREVLPHVPVAVLRTVVQMIGLEYVIVAPLLARDRIIGALTVWGRDLAADDLPAMVVLAQQAATAYENARLYQEAQAALRARDEFLTVAAHELKTPLTSLQGRAQLELRRFRREHTVSPERFGQVLETVEAQARRLTRLVDDLFDVSRLEHGTVALRRAPADVVELVRRVVADRQDSLRRPLCIEAPDAPLVASVDELRLEQVLTNMIDNADKFSPPDSTVEVAVAAPDAETVRLSVRDYGAGIAPEDRERVFERFYQVPGRRDPAQQRSHAAGLGLGLHICRQLVALHAGRIEIEAPADGGTRFVVTLPRSPRATDDAGGDTSQEPQEPQEPQELQGVGGTTDDPAIDGAGNAVAGTSTGAAREER